MEAKSKLPKHRLRGTRTGCRGKHFDLRGNTYRKNGENCIMKSFIEKLKVWKRYCWIIKSSGMWRRVLKRVVLDVSKYRSGLIFWFKQSKRRGGKTLYFCYGDIAVEPQATTQWQCKIYSLRSGLMTISNELLHLNKWNVISTQVTNTPTYNVQYTVLSQQLQSRRQHETLRLDS